MVLSYAETVGQWMQSKGMEVVVEDEDVQLAQLFVCLSRRMADFGVTDAASVVGETRALLRLTELTEHFVPADLVVTLGGDGTVLHTASLFKLSVPPMVSFNLGSLGFLTRQQLPDYRTDLSSLFAGNMFLMLRSRLRCRLMKRDPQSDGWLVAAEHQVLNEVVIDKGGSANLTLLDTYCDGVYVTTVQADGVIVCTGAVFLR